MTWHYTFAHDISCSPVDSLLLDVHFSGMNFSSRFDALSPEDQTLIFSYCGVSSQTRLALCSRTCLAAYDEGDAALVSQQLRVEAAIDRMREIDTTFLTVMLRGGTAVTTDLISSLTFQKPVEVVMFCTGSSEVASMLRIPAYAKCIVSAEITKRPIDDPHSSGMQARQGTRHLKLAVMYAGSRRWNMWLEERTHHQIVEELSRMGHQERCSLLGPILSVTTGSSNLPGLATKPVNDMCITFLPKTPTDLEAAQPALRLVVEQHHKTQYSKEAWCSALSYAKKAMPTPPEWDDLPTSVEHDGRTLHLHMAIDNSRTRLGDARPQGSLTGYLRVYPKISHGGQHVGYFTNSRGEIPAFHTRFTRRAAWSRTAQQYPSAKAALVAVATHVAIHLKMEEEMEESDDDWLI